MDKFTFTTAGLEYAAKAAAGSVMEFTKGKYGSGSPPDDTMSLTDLVNPLGELALVSKSVTDSTVTVKTSFTNVVDGEILPAFHLTEVGLFARVLDTDGNEAEPETLVGYACVSGDDTGDYIANTPTEFVLNWPFSISSTDNVTVSVTMDAYALKEDVEKKADKTTTYGRFAGGSDAIAEHGGAVGNGATSTNGFAGGNNALTSDGVAVGADAQTADADGNAIDAIQLGTGTNSTEKTLQVYDYQLLDADGIIPADRIAKSVKEADLDTLTQDGLYEAENIGLYYDLPVMVKRTLNSDSCGYVTQYYRNQGEMYYRSVEINRDNDETWDDVTFSGVSWERMNTTAAELDTATDTVQDQLEAFEQDCAQLYVVSDLPSSTAEYDFSDGTSRFVTGYRTACSAESDTDNGGYYQKITNSGNSNTYRTAVLDCSDVMANATSMTVRFDALFSGRWHISLADLSQRPGESTGSTYTDAGCAFSIGSTDGSNLKVYGADGTMTLTGWKTVKAVLDFSVKTVEYTVTDRTAGTVLQTGTIPFRDTSVTAITGFEAYTWSTGDLLIDNISIVSLTGARENARYLVKTDDGYDEYQYIDGEAVQITKKPMVSYSSAPTQIGTWIDGTPVWRFAFLRTFTETELNTIKSTLEWEVDWPQSLKSFDYTSFIKDARAWVTYAGACIVDNVECVYKNDTAAPLFSVPQTAINKENWSANDVAIMGWFEVICPAA